MKILYFGFTDNLHECIYASNLIISFAGQDGRSTIDTSMESMAYSIPGIYINNRQTK